LLAIAFPLRIWLWLLYTFPSRAAHCLGTR
jgi:hypothetical protein